MGLLAQRSRGTFLRPQSPSSNALPRGTDAVPRAVERLLCVVLCAAQLLHHPIHILILCATADLIEERAVEFTHAQPQALLSALKRTKGLLFLLSRSMALGAMVLVHGLGAPYPGLSKEKQSRTDTILPSSCPMRCSYAFRAFFLQETKEG